MYSLVLVIAGGICLLGLAVFLSLFVLFRDKLFPYAIHSLTNTLSNYKLTNNKSKKTKKKVNCEPGKDQPDRN